MEGVLAATASVLAVLVCADEHTRLRQALDALRGSAAGPARVLAVRTGESAETARLLDEAVAEELVDEVLTASGPVTAAVSEAIAAATREEEVREEWLWLLTADTAPESGCLGELLAAAEREPDAAAIGPLVLDAADPRFVLDAGLSIDRGGRVRTGASPSEVDPVLLRGQESPDTELLAVASAGVLLRREVYERIGGHDPALRGDAADVDLGWRINADGNAVLLAPRARAQRSARADGSRPRTRRSDGARTLLLDVPARVLPLAALRLLLSALLRAPGFLLARRPADAAAEAALLVTLLRGGFGLRPGRAARSTAIPERRPVRGLLVGPLDRLRWTRRRIFERFAAARARRDPALLDPVPETALAPDTQVPAHRRRGVPSLRRPGDPVVVLADPGRPAPGPREGAREPRLVRAGARRLLRGLLVDPPAVLLVVLLVFGVLTCGGWFLEVLRGGTPQGGRLLPIGDLVETWGSYLAAWHPAGGGAASPATPGLLVFGLLGAVLGGPPAAVGLLVLLAVPLAGLSAYLATRPLGGGRVRRSLVAGAYALLPAAALSAGQGRLDVVVVHVLLPVLLAGIARVLRRTRAGGLWLGPACLTALGLALLGAFAPLAHVVLVVLMLGAFVAVPGREDRFRRRIAGLAVLVLLPVACLLPWPLVVLEQPRLLLHGPGASAVEPAAGGWPLLLSPDGSVPALLGGLLLIAALVAAVRGPLRPQLPGLALAAAGIALALLVAAIPVEPLAGGPASAAWTGTPLVLAATGCCWALLATRPVQARWGRAAAAGVLAVLAAAAGTAALTGPLHAAPQPELPGSVLALDQHPPRLGDGAAGRFGDDDLVPAPGAAQWVRGVASDLTSADDGRVLAGVRAATARGVEFLRVPDGFNLPERARELVRERPGGVLQLPDGAARVQLLGPDLTRQARTGHAPPPQAAPLPVDALPPDVTVRVTAGGEGRALVLGAQQQPGWYALVDGRPVGLADAWGNQVAVPLPERAAEVRIGYAEGPRTALLAVQAGALLFAVVGALPPARRSTGSR
nr:glycosyltransferase [Saccharopolyspora sp. HNM0983]